jgi:hypothetical protein
MNCCAAIARNVLAHTHGFEKVTLRRRKILNNGSQLVQVNVIKYTPSFSAMALRTGMS